MKDTKQSPRRTLRFDSYDQVVAEAERLVSIEATGSGNWTLGEMIDHVGLTLGLAVHGFGFKMPLPVRIVGRLMRKRLLTKGFSAGIKPPRTAWDRFAPEPGVDVTVALDRLRRFTEEAKRAESMAASPLVGQLTNAEWEALHCRHAELHFSFFDADADSSNHSG